MYQYGQVPTNESSKETVVLIFNRLNGVFLSSTNLGIELCDLDHPLCIYVEDVMDMQTDEVVGGLTINDDGTWVKDYKIIPDYEVKPTIYESEMDSAAAYKITKRYTVVEQVNVLGRAINILAKEHGIELTELDEMLDYIKLVKDTSKNHKTFYMENDNYDYISNEQQEELDVAKFEGGLHEALGPRTITGGSVFS